MYHSIKLLTGCYVCVLSDVLAMYHSTKLLTGCYVCVLSDVLAMYHSTKLLTGCYVCVLSDVLAMYHSTKLLTAAVYRDSKLSSLRWDWPQGVKVHDSQEHKDEAKVSRDQFVQYIMNKIRWGAGGIVPWVCPEAVELCVRWACLPDWGLHFEGSQPEWCISSMIYSRDTPFWSETLDWCKWKGRDTGDSKALYRRDCF